MRSAQLYLKGQMKTIQCGESDGCHLGIFYPSKREANGHLSVSSPRPSFYLSYWKSIPPYEHTEMILRIIEWGPKIISEVYKAAPLLGFIRQGLSQASFNSEKANRNVYSQGTERQTYIGRTFISWSKHWWNNFVTSTERMLGISGHCPVYWLMEETWFLDCLWVCWLIWWCSSQPSGPFIVRCSQLEFSIQKQS